MSGTEVYGGDYSSGQSYTSFVTYVTSLVTSLGTATYPGLWPIPQPYVEDPEDTKARQKAAQRAEEPPA
jgi:hypothetical protein